VLPTRSLASGSTSSRDDMQLLARVARRRFAADADWRSRPTCDARAPLRVSAAFAASAFEL